MRILHVVPTYLPATRYGGPIYAVHGLCRSLAARGHTVEVFTTNVDGRGVSDVPTLTRVEIDSVGVTYFPSPFRRTYWSPRLRSHVRNSVKTFDIVHLHSVFLHPTLAAARAAFRSGVPYVVSPRGMLVETLINTKSRILKRSWIRLFERKTIRSAASVHLTSDVELRDFRELGLKAGRIDVVPNGIDIVDPLGSRPATEKYILFLGRLNWKKRPQVVIDTLKELGTEWRAVLAGPSDGSMANDLRMMAEQAGTAGRIVFAGEVDGARKRELLAGASLLVLPSISENFGNVVLEAAIEGTPAALTRGVGLADAFGRERAGFILEDPVDTFPAQIRAILDSPELLATGRRARALAESMFGWDGVAARMEELYSELIARHRA